MKIWCEKCKGKGTITKHDIYDELCDFCQGNGYTEPEKPTTEINIDYYNELKAKADKYDEINSSFENALNELQKELDEIGESPETAEKTFERYKLLIIYKTTMQAKNIIKI